MTALHDTSSPTSGRRPGTFYVSLTGEVDVSRAAELGGIIDDFRASGCSNAEVDLERVTFMDSTFLAILVQLRNVGLERGGSVALVAPSASSLKLLKIVSFDSLFEIRAPYLSPG